MKYLPPLAALDAMTHIGLADDGDVGLGVAGVVHVASGSDGDESGNQDLIVEIILMLIVFIECNSV